MKNNQPVIKRTESGVPMQIWVGNPEEGFINTVIYMLCEAKTVNFFKLEEFRQKNLKQGAIDISIVAVLSLLSALIEDDDKEKDRIEYLFFKLHKDMFILNTLGSIYNSKMPIASVSYSADMMTNLLNIPNKGLEPLIKQTGLGRTAYSLTTL